MEVERLSAGTEPLSAFPFQENSFHIYRNDDDQDFNVLEEHG